MKTGTTVEPPQNLRLTETPDLAINFETVQGAKQYVIYIQDELGNTIWSHQTITPFQLNSVRTVKKTLKELERDDYSVLKPYVNYILTAYSQSESDMSKGVSVRFQLSNSQVEMLDRVKSDRIETEKTSDPEHQIINKMDKNLAEQFVTKFKEVLKHTEESLAEIREKLKSVSTNDEKMREIEQRLKKLEENIETFSSSAAAVEKRQEEISKSVQQVLYNQEAASKNMEDKLTEIRVRSETQTLPVSEKVISDLIQTMDDFIKASKPAQLPPIVGSGKSAAIVSLVLLLLFTVLWFKLPVVN